MKLAVRLPNLNKWTWVARRDVKNNIGLVVTGCKDHALWPEDLDYFKKMFPGMDFQVRESIDD